MPAVTHSILSLDVGDKRVGIAIASVVARLPRPLLTLPRNDKFIPDLRKIISDEAVETLVVGLPRGLDGQHTKQTQVTETFIDELKTQLKIPVYTQDEALTSVQAESELQAHGATYQRGDIDALAAAYILEDWLQENTNQQKGEHVTL